MLKKYLSNYWGDVVILGLILALGGAMWFEHAQKSLAGGPFNNVKQYLTVNADPYMNHLLASSTQTNLVYINAATTSYAFATDNADQVNFNLLALSATTTSVLKYPGMPDEATTSNTGLNLAYCYDFSDDQNYWFPGTSNCATFVTASNATTTRNIAVTDVNSKYMRIGFKSPNSTSTRVGLWAQAILRKGF